MQQDLTDNDKNSIPLPAQSDPEWYTAPAAGHNSGGGYSTVLSPHRTVSSAGEAPVADGADGADCADGAGSPFRCWWVAWNSPSGGLDTGIARQCGG